MRTLFFGSLQAFGTFQGSLIVAVALILGLFGTAAGYAQPPSQIDCDTDVTDLIAGVTGTVGVGTNTANTLYFIDGGTGDSTAIFTASVIPNHLAFDSERQIFYYIQHNGDDLYAYDLNSGVETLVQANLATTNIPGTGDMPAGFTGHDAGTYWNGRYYVIPPNATAGETGDDLHWIEFSANGLTIADSGLIQMDLPGTLANFGDFGDIVITQAGILFGSSTDQGASQMEGLFTADLNDVEPIAVTVLNATYTGAQLALSGDETLYGNDYTTGEIAEINKTTGAIINTVNTDSGGDYYDLAPVSPHSCDYGDLDDPPYDTLLASNGPSHKTGVFTNIILGSSVDSETDGQPTSSADGDGVDDDGVSFDTPLNPGDPADITVTVTAAGFLNAWIDFNSDGDFSDTGEQIATNLAVVAGANLLDDVSVPAGATGIMAARFRVTVLTGQGGGSPTGAADNGEVEDYVLATLGNFVWNDSIVGQGIQVGGDTPVQNVSVSLLASDGTTAITDGAGTAITTLTDAGGNYEFPGLPPGTYRVQFTLPGGFVDFSPRDNAGDDTIDSDAEQVSETTPGLTGSVSLVAADADIDLDAGLRAVTAALIASAAAYVDGGEVVFEFSTGYEALSSSFEVHRLDPRTGDHEPVTEGPMTALLGSPQGGVYRVRDETAPFSQQLSYVITEHQADGRTLTYGPFSIGLEPRGDRRPLDESSATRPHVSKRLRQRLAKARKAEAHRVDAIEPGGSSRAGVRVFTAQVDVADDGLYFVSSADLAAALGQPEGMVREAVTRHYLEVENRGRPVAWSAPGGTDDGLFFYGEAIDSLYTATNTYWIRLNASGVPMEVIDGGAPKTDLGGIFTSTERFEEDLLPSINSTVETEVDYWYWDGINAAGDDRIRTFDVTVPDSVAGAATITARFAGASNGLAPEDHHAIIRVNGVELGTAAWGGMERFEAAMTFDGSLLTPVTTIEVEGTLEGGTAESIFFIDGFDLEYQRLYRAVDDRLLLIGDGNLVVTVEGLSTPDVMVVDLSDPASPEIQSNVLVEAGAGGFQASFVPSDERTPYFVTTLSAARAGSNLRQVSPGLELTLGHHRFEHVVIAPQAWLSAAEDLAAYRSSQGMRSVAISIEEVYNDFSHGNATPWAIRDFLSYARDHWLQAPDYVVLAGRGTLDPRNLLGDGDSFIPVVLLGTRYGLVASDNVLADLVGADSIPEVALGRLPIVGATELADYTAKLEAYEAAGGDWRDRALMVADNPDAAGDFTQQSEAVAKQLGSFSLQKVYLGELDIDSARTALQAAWNEGVQLVNYVGHGGVTLAAVEGLLRATDMDLLANGERLPIVSALTCALGRSDIPSVESLAEALVTDVDGGAIAVWAPAGYSYSGEAHELNLLYAIVLEGSPQGVALGDIVRQTLGAFGAAGGAVDMLNAYAIAGDPAVQLP